MKRSKVEWVECEASGDVDSAVCPHIDQSQPRSRAELESQSVVSVSLCRTGKLHCQHQSLSVAILIDKTKREESPRPGETKGNY